ncbi:MAG TPA: BamA/TamA family outer membrane protein [Mucilaginibacter sp.]|nr:BamA/TamA family outer membrane protein [Mucilaginibacter sp.]
MIKRTLFFYSIFTCLGFIGYGQVRTSSTPKQQFQDSIVVAIRPSYNKVSGIHRWLFGENYRKEWSMPVKLPVIRISQLHGGLKPVKQGGGMESKSLRLVDPTGKEWVLRSVEKIPDKLLPVGVEGTFVVDWVDDEFSAQHPYSALVVPPLAAAVGVPHANPVIGVVVSDPALGEYNKIFSNLVCLMEEREPTGHSDNTLKMEVELIKNYHNRLDGEEFLKARMLDLLLGDWDRHEDQWRFTDTVVGANRIYTGVPRDRDQVFHLAEGVFPSIASRSWLDPTLDHFEGDIPRVRYSLFKTRFIKQFPDAQISYDRWMQLANEFAKAETDQVLESALKQLPSETYKIRHDVLFNKLRQRRDHIPAAMSEYYKWINRIVDLRTTDKDENISLTDDTAGGLRVTVSKAGKKDAQLDTIWNIVYHPDITKELRLYTSGGNDKILINTSKSVIKVRIVDSAGTKAVENVASQRKIDLYGPVGGTTINGDAARIRNRLSTDTAAGRFVPTYLYNVWMPLATASLNVDDGFLLGLGFKYTGFDGFRKLPYTTVQQLMVTHAFASDAFRLRYDGEWTAALGKADILLRADIQAPDNTMNFFGRGNETVLDKTGDYHRFYRVRFDQYKFDPALRWHTGKGSVFIAGPSLQYYHFQADDNTNRYISQPASRANAYDSLTFEKPKVHLGINASFISDRRNNNVLPYAGYYINVQLLAYNGVGSNADNFMQIKPEFTYYQKLNQSGSIVLSDRIGGGVTFGKPAFYQSLFLGGQGNLLGYLQNRFAGQEMIFNNLQGRVKLFNLASYILAGQVGLIGFYDTGRVWVSDKHSDKWHQGTGGGLYFAPAGLTCFQFLAGHSSEGWYPYISMNFRL